MFTRASRRSRFLSSMSPLFPVLGLLIVALALVLALPVPALDRLGLSVLLTIPFTATLEMTDVLTVMARSQGDPAQVAQARVEVQVITKSYLPVVLRR